MTALPARLPPHPPAGQPHVGLQAPAAGWYPDPWVPGGWRWFTGQNWSSAAQGPPQPAGSSLPPWVSLPVVLCGVPVLLLLLVLVLTAPVAATLSLIPPLIVLPALIWLDRLAPEPVSTRVHALLWGATVGVAAGLVLGGPFALFGEVAATVVGAPVSEELGKGLVVVWAYRRGHINGVIDGVVYAAWAGVGFATVENVLYLAAAQAEGQLALVFVLRGLLSPFAHPLFTASIGVAVGRAISRNQPVGPAALAGYAVAVVLHGVWNAAALATTQGGAGVALAALVAVGFLVLFTATVIVLARLRSVQLARVAQLLPWLAARHGLSPQVVMWLTHRPVAAVRRPLSPPDRARYDSARSALTGLALITDRPGGPPAAAEAALRRRLSAALAGR